MRYSRIYILICLLLPHLAMAQQVVSGTVLEDGTGGPVANAAVWISNSPYSVLTDKNGHFLLTLPGKTLYRLLVSHPGYQSQSRELRFRATDTLRIALRLKQKLNALDSVTVRAVHKPETLVAKPDYSIFDFEFYEDKLLLLTSQGSLSRASIRLSDYNGKIISSYELPRQAGEARHFFHDYEGYSEVVCKDSVFRIDVMDTELMILPIPQTDFNRYLLPVADTLNDHYYYNDRWEKYPMFNYYYLKKHDSLNHVLSTIANADLMKLYNLEYYYLPPRMQLEARRTASYYKIDVHIVAALMSGFTQSLFYEPLYAPLFILRDTICIFNHHNDHLYHYSKQNVLIDSIRISYHHPKNWREWKKRLIVDETENKVYAFFSRNGRHYLKHISHQTGKELGTYKLKHHSAEKIKIKDGYVYYVYRPFASTQERFLYRERIE